MRMPTRQIRFRFWMICLVPILLSPLKLQAEDPSLTAANASETNTTKATGTELNRGPAEIDFNRDVRPILSAACFHCHGPDPETREAELRLDLRESAVLDRGGYRVVQPGEPAKSELITRITSEAPELVMPPAGSGHDLSAEQRGILRKWIELGAEYAPHWAFVPPTRPAVPQDIPADAIVFNDVDRFILHRLKQSGLGQSPLADRYALIRRLSLDLTGLPPTRKEVKEFVNDTRPDAYERLVDRLLASPAYGEHWARMWLDLARYADSAGYGSDPLRLNIWPYRDWVIDAFNANMPYDQFTIKQLAGDLLPNPTEQQLVATAFHRNTMTNTEGGTDDEEFRVAAVKDRIATTIQVWMGLTMNCAQCHTHKYDPISQEEYYRVFSVFNQTADTDQPNEAPTLPLYSDEQKKQRAELNTQIAAVREQIAHPPEAFQSELAAWSSAYRIPSPRMIFQIDSATSLLGRSLTIHESQRLEFQQTAEAAKTDNSDTVRLKIPLTRLPSGETFPWTALTLSWSRVTPEEVVDDDATKLGELPIISEVTLRQRSVENPPQQARFVRVELPGSNPYLSLAEVQVFSGDQNLALKGTATQSSTSHEGVASLAIDGNTNGDFFAAKSTTHTAGEANPWWEVDLGSPAVIDRVVVWNRTDGNVGTRLNHFKVQLLDQDRKSIFETVQKQPPAPYVSLPTDGAKPVGVAAVELHSSASGVTGAQLIDGDSKTGWKVDPDAKDATTTLELETPLPSDGHELIVELDITGWPAGEMLPQLTLSGVSTPRPVVNIPSAISEIVMRPEADRTESQRQQLAEFYRPHARALATEHARLDKLEKQLAAINPVPLPIMQQVPEDKRRKTHIMLRGNFLTLGEEVGPGFLEAFHKPAEETPATRLGLAKWLVDKRNPLTARVAVNRFWAQLFGRGIVLTLEDFGTQGEPPSHPELLDWLAFEFMDSDWNMRRLLRTIVTSATYRQQSVIQPDALAKDPQDRLLWRYPRQRLSAEEVRDQALAVSGLLHRELHGPSVYPPQPDGLWRAAFNGQRNWATSQGPDRYRRGLYTFWRRTVPYPSMAVFDAPSRENCTLRREPTNTPLQAFVTLNDPAYVEMAQALARRIVREGGSDAAQRAKFALELVLCRPAQDEQIATVVKLMKDSKAVYESDKQSAEKLAVGTLGPLADGEDPLEFAAWTVVANILLNLDAVMTKG